MNWFLTFHFSLLVFLLSSCQATVNRQQLNERFVVTDRLPSQQVTAIEEDCRGYIWIGTQNGLCRYGGQTYAQYFLGNDSLQTQYVSVTCLEADGLGNLWIGTSTALYCHSYGKGISKLADGYISRLSDSSSDYMFYSDGMKVWRIDKNTFKKEVFYEYSTPLSKNTVIADDFGKLWVSEGDELHCMDIETFATEKELKTDGTFLTVLKMGGNLFVATDKGFRILDMSTKEWADSEELESMNRTFREDPVQKLFAYSNHSFLIYTNAKAIYYYDTQTSELLRDENFNPFQNDNKPYALSAFLRDSHENMWFGTERNGCKAIYSRQTLFSHNSYLSYLFKDRIITNLSADSHGNLWIVAENQEIFRYGSDGKIMVLRHNESNVMKVLADEKGGLWIVCKGHLYYGKLQGELFLRTADWKLSVLSIVVDNQDNTYIGSYEGVIYCKASGSKDFIRMTSETSNYKAMRLMKLRDGRLAMLEAFTGVYLTYDYIGVGETALSELFGSNQQQVYFIDLCEDFNDRLWVATSTRGVVSVDLRTMETKLYDSEEYSHAIRSILCDEFGNIWAGTGNGLTCLNPQTGEINTFYEDLGIEDAEFATQGAVSLPGGQLVFSNMKGITSFAPKDLKSFRPDKLQLGYLTVDQELLQDLSLNDEVFLEHDNMGIEFTFTSLQYGNPHPNYQYKMEGFDPGWNKVSGQERAYYSHLPSGKYVFRVRVAGASGDSAEQKVKVTVRPSLWEMPVMKWFVYPVVSLLAMALLLHFWNRRKENLRALADLAKEKEEEQRANELNMRFFSNISHEFRTPLTLINGALSMISSTNADRMHQIMHVNTQRMMRIVNQLMDFNKMESGMLRLCVSRTDVTSLTSQIVGMFEASLKSHSMTVQIIQPQEPIISWIDRDKFEKVLVNLVSNAIKYSGDGNSLKISLSEKVSDGVKWLQVDVADTGIGVPPEKREEIFLRFYQLKQTGQMPAIGTGIGLYYTRSLVELHHGSIKCLDNEPHGSVFSFSLPADETSYSDTEKQSPQTSWQQEETETSHRLQESGESFGEGKVDSPANALVLMIVDDDPDIMNFLQMLLSPHYQLSCYSNAAAAYQEIEAVKPDLILSDVMMCEIDGYRFCQMVKDNSSICHIPVVLLTAKTALAEQIQGLRCGASAYITKPFSPDYLLSMIKSQLDNVRRIQQALTGSTKVEPAEEKALQTADKKFMDQLYAFIEQHLSDTELRLDELTKEVGMSRTKLFYKTKALTGETPNGFFKNYKLNRAAEMILEGEKKISYIADVTGFSSSSYFSANFKKRFGCLPSEYKRQRITTPPPYPMSLR